MAKRLLRVQICLVSLVDSDRQWFDSNQGLDACETSHLMLMIMPIPVPIPAALFAIAYVGYSYWASTRSGGRINHDAHLCGALGGLGFVAVADPAAIADLLKIIGIF